MTKPFSLPHMFSFFVLVRMMEEEEVWSELDSVHMNVTEQRVKKR